MNSPVHSLIKECVELEFQKLEKSKITPWAFLLNDKGLTLTDFFGKSVSYTGVQFEGSPRDVFWGGFIQPFLNDIVSKSFSKTRDFCRKENLNSKLPLEETAGLLKVGIQKAYERMADIDQGLRGRGFPKSVLRYNPKNEISRSYSFVDERLVSELALQSMQKKTLNNFYEEHKFWFWSIGIIISAVIGILIKVFV